MPETLAPSPDDTPFEHRVFQLTREDALAWLSRPRPISSLGAKLALVSILIPALLISVFENAMVARFPWLTGFVEIAVGAAALVTYFLAAWAIGAFEGWKRLRKAQAPSTLTAVSLFGDRLVVQEDGEAKIYPFDKLHDPIGTDTHLFIPRWSDDDDVIIMPLRAFEDRTHMEVFGHMVHDWINKSDNDEQVRFV